MELDLPALTMYVSINSDELAGVAVSWRDVGLQLGRKTILDRVSGDARPGELLALMGPSGAGKTTLLNVLSGRLEGFTGRVATTGMVGALRVAYIDEVRLNREGESAYYSVLVKSVDEQERADDAGRGRGPEGRGFCRGLRAGF